MFVGYGNNHAHILDDAAMLQVHRLVAREHGLEAGVDKEQPHHKHRPVEHLDESETGHDENAAQYKCANNSPQQHSHLMLGRHLKVGKYHDEYHDIVHAQGFFDEIARQELDRGVGPKAK